jgi:hypothetical protein
MAEVAPVEEVTGSEPTPDESQEFAWYLVGALVAVMIGWCAAQMQLASLSPVVLLPLAAGFALGVVLTGLAAITRLTARRQLLIGAALLSILAVLAEHAWLYHDFRRQWQEARGKSPQVAMFRPETPWSPAEYLAREASPSRMALWCVDAALVTVATVGTVSVGLRHNK